MTEFGHVAKQVGEFHVDTWGIGPFRLVISGVEFLFEDSDRFGPLVLRKDGSPRDRQPGERHPFWRLHRIWASQGRRVAEDGTTCLWDEPKPTYYRQLGKRSGLIVEDGDENGAFLPVAEPEAGAT